MVCDKLILSIINYGYFENDIGPVLFVKCRDENQKPYILEIQDERLDPVFYILKSDYTFFKDTAKSLYLNHLIKRTSKGIPTYWDEQTVAIYTKYPRDVKKLRDKIRSIPYFNADIKWEKKVAQQLQWKQFIEVTDYQLFSFTPLNNIKNSDESFKVEQNICYWDIEIDGSKLKTLRKAWKTPHDYDIISYVTYHPFDNLYTYYGWKPTWKLSVTQELHSSELLKSTKINKHPMIKTYPKISDVLIKKFSNEKDMHKAFIEDFGRGDYDGVLMFNGRGGNIVNKSTGSSNRSWRDGFDMPMWYEKIASLGLKKEVQYMSPLPVSTTWKKPVAKYMQFKNGECTKNEIHIDCIPQHDIYFDNTIMKFTKDQQNMKDEKLDTYLKNFLGMQKVEHKDMVWELFEKDWEKEKHYNIVDVEAMFALDKYFNFTDDVLGRALVYGCKIEDVMYASKLHDHIYLWYASEKYCLDIRNQSRGRWRGFIDKKVGGYNRPIEKGGVILGYPKEEFGFIIDFSKLYPSCVMSVNADIRTKVEFDHYENKGKIIVDRFGKKYPFEDLCRSPAGFFRKDIEAQNTIIYKTMIKQRNIIDKEIAKHLEFAKKATDENDYHYHKIMAEMYTVKSHSFKNLINGKFGADGMGSEDSMFRPRTYDLVIYNTPPSMGQEILKYVLDVLLPKYGYNPFFASTDSSMVKAKSKTAWDTWREAEEVSKRLNKDLDVFIKKKYNPIHNYIVIGCEKVFSQCILFNKRMYMLKTIIEDTKKGPIELHEPKTYIRGLEYLKSNSSMVTTEVQYKLLKMFIDMKTIDEIKSYIRKVDKEFESYDWSYISSRSSISKDPEKAKTNSQNFNACKNANNFCGKDYRALARPYLGIFKSVPSTMKGVSKNILYFNKHRQCPIAYDDGDQSWMEKYSFKLDYDKHKELNLISKIERFFILAFGLDYWDFLEDDANANEV